MKTATVDQYHIMGTQSSRGIRLIYRGKTLMHLMGHVSENPKMLGAVLRRAHEMGFTHWRRAGTGLVSKLEAQP